LTQQEETVLAIWKLEKGLLEPGGQMETIGNFTFCTSHLLIPNDGLNQK